MAKLKLTTVKVLEDLYDKDFKMFIIRDGINFQKLVNRAMDLYTKNDDFRKQINGYTGLQISGSQL
jgi:hypothetical protein